MEYAKFETQGVKFVQREDADHPWVNVLPEDEGVVALSMAEAKQVAMARREAFLAANTLTPSDPRWGDAPRKLMATITRSVENEARAAKLGLTADQMADRLARPDENDGTVARLPEAEFDAMMAELGLSPAEARARFNGTFWI